MIEFVFDHSNEEDYYMLSHINVDIKDPIEKERIEKKLKELSLEGMLEYPNRAFKNRIAEKLNVDEKLITYDTEEIDLM